MHLINACNQCFKNIRTSKLLVNITKFYHSEAIYGFKPKVVKEYKVPEHVIKARINESNFYRLVNAYRQHAHKVANIDPVKFQKNPNTPPELDLSHYGLNQNDVIKFQGIINHEKPQGTIQEALEFLNKTYTKNLSVEYVFLETQEEIEYFSNIFEQESSKPISDEEKKTIAKELLKSQAFDNFMANKFTTVKRYGGEGAESMMAFFSELFKISVKDEVQDIVLAMPHRGRLNLLTGMLKFPPAKMFAKFKGFPDFPHEKFEGIGDVLSHSISSVDLEIDDRRLHVSLLYNPSHLEAVNPVSMGKTRAKYMSNKSGGYDFHDEFGSKILNIQVHGDAAFAGQGVNQECLALAQVPHFEIGGTIHLVVNNQVGFTTPGYRGRSSKYCTDLAKMISAPILHVNGDHPEEVIKATRIAFDYQRKFKKDVFIDMNCYRQWGHNEVDDPTFTNPTLYSVIHSRRTVPDIYAENLVNNQILTQKEVDDIKENHFNWLNNELKTVENYKPEDPCFKKQWSGFIQAKNEITSWDTGINEELMSFIGNKSVEFPQNFNIHPHLLKTYVKTRLNNMKTGRNIDWATAEAIAMGSLLYQGYNIRFSGQDVGRGTFSHRHAMLIDQKTNNMYIPLNSLDKNQTGFLEVANSILSEEAVLGYEYGMSIENPNNLIIWEAQFGDFFNGAQIIFDTCISSGEAKWLWSSGLTILLPHGYDGAGPEHSSCRIERFLQSTDSKEDKPDGDNVNMEICQPSTPAQYFHLLRRQMLRNYRKPLIIVAPKTLIRLSAAQSTFLDMNEGTSFQTVISDNFVDPKNVTKVILTSGKHYYTLFDKLQDLGVNDTAIIRVESFCPFPILELQKEVQKFSRAKVFIWAQEEPRNMGAWTYIKPRFENLLGRNIRFAGRDTLPAPAVGVGKWHQSQVEEIINKPFLIK